MILILFFVFAWSVSARYVKVDTRLGTYTVSVLYDPDRPFPENAFHVKTYGNTLMVVATPGGLTESIMGRTSTTKQIVVNPRGCDAKSPLDAVHDLYCQFGGALAYETDLDHTLKQWTLRADSPQCEDPSTCFGPLYLTTEGWTPDQEVTDRDLLRSRRGVFVVSPGGPTGEIPMITYIPIVMPQLNVTGTCDGINGQYELSAVDNYEGAYTNTTYVYAKKYLGPTRRILLWRSGVDQFRVVLSVVGGSSEFYTVLRTSNQTYSGIDDVLDTGSVDFDDGCKAEVSIVPAPRPLALIPPRLPDDLTYARNIQGKGYVTSECGIRRGSYDELGALVFPDLPYPALGGGFIRFRSPGPFGQRYRVDPDPRFKDFVWTCVKFYPASGTFNDYMAGGDETGGLQSRDAPDMLACRAPFPLPKRIADKREDSEEKRRQCKMLGGITELLTESHCIMDVTETKCRLGWYFFDEACYYKPDADKDTKYKTRQSQGDQVCSELHPKAKATLFQENDVYLKSWLERFFVFFDRTSCGTNPVRISITGTQCLCYDCSPTLSTSVAVPCDCEDPQFPLCRYLVKDDWIEWNDVKYHPATIQIMRDGQCAEGSECYGNHRPGRELSCECFPGNTGEYCERRTCIPNARTIVGEGLLLKFAQVCDVHGYCVEGQEDMCHCAQGYGPPSVFGADDHNTHACSLPSILGEIEGGYEIDGVVYDEPYGVCGGRSNGVGICDPGTKLCRCECRTRVNMDPDGEPEEPSWEGIQCAGRTPMLPAEAFQINEPIVERMCNARGTICPSGERIDRKFLEGTYTVIQDADQCRGKPDGCVCDDGYWGHSCTVPIPKNVAAKSVYSVDSVRVPIKGGNTLIKNVHISTKASYAGVTPNCEVVDVSISDNYEASDRMCNATHELGRYWCGESAAGSFVIVKTIGESVGVSCDIRAFSENHLPCGNWTDKRAARLYANEIYRDFGKYEEFQSQEFSQYGGTTTECSCDADHTGKLCKTRVSSKGIDYDGKISNRVCGESSLPPRGKPTDEGCECFAFAGFDFSGDESCACAIVNGELCGGMGECITPKMSYGRCEFDVEDEKNDALATPFTAYIRPEDSNIRTFTFHDLDFGEGDRRSVVVLDGESWLLSEGQTVFIESVFEDIYIRESNIRFPLNMTHDCANLGTRSPVRAVANVTLKSVQFVCDVSDTGNPDCYLPQSVQEWCDPAFSCSSTLICTPGIPKWNDTETKCIEILGYYEDDLEDKLLVSNRYVDSWILRANATVDIPPRDRSFPYGEFPTCSNPVYRWLDDSLFGAGLVTRRQCEGTISSHSNVKGEMYGLFDDAVPGLSYRSDEWTDEHYQFVAALTNDMICVDQRGDYIYDALSGKVIDDYGISLVNIGPETVSIFSNDTEPAQIQFNNETSNWFFEGLYGSPYVHTEIISVWPNLTSSVFTQDKRPGGFLRIPNLKSTDELRRLAIRNSGSRVIDGFQIIGPTGRVCATRLYPFKPNDTVVVDCGTTIQNEDFSVLLRRIYEYGSNATELLELLKESPSAVLMWYSPLEWSPNTTVEIDFVNGDFQTYSRATSYTQLWKSIAAQIVTARTFPRNLAFENECQKKGGTRRPLDLTRDKGFLEGLHGTHLAARRCSHEWQCKRFARDSTKYKCLLSNDVPSVGWRNGDPLKDETTSGDQGGCSFAKSKELVDPQFSGSKCMSGYEEKWHFVVEFERQARLKLPEFPFVLVNLTEPWVEQRVECTIPTGSSNGRPTDACGGSRGILRRSYFESNSSFVVHDKNKIKRCISIVVNEDETLGSVEGDFIDLHTFQNGQNIVNVIKGDIYWNGERMAGICEDRMCIFPSGDRFRCVERSESSTHRVMTFRDGSAVETQVRDFWTLFLR